MIRMSKLSCSNYGYVSFTEPKEVHAACKPQVPPPLSGCDSVHEYWGETSNKSSLGPSLQYGKLKITAPSYVLYYNSSYFNADCMSLLLKEGESIYVDVDK